MFEVPSAPGADRIAIPDQALFFMGYAARRNATFLAWKSINQWKT
jgi:hypothetical protein